MTEFDPKPRRDLESVADRFFENHLAGVRARLEAQTRRALDRQRLAWRESLHREAVLEDRDFEPIKRS